MRWSPSPVRTSGRGAAPLRPGTLGTLAAVAAGVLVAGVGLPSAQASQSAVATVVVGTVERLHLDDFSHPLPAGADEITFVRTSGGAVQVPESDLRSVPDGATVRLGLADTSGTRLTPAGSLTADLTPAESRDPEAGADVATVDVVSTPQEGTVATGTGYTQAATVASGAATHQVLVVVAQPPGSAGTTVTAQQVADTVNAGVNGYWQTVTGGAVGFTATAYPTVVATTNPPCSNGGVSTSSAFWAEVQQKTGWVSGPGQHLVVYFPAYAACGGIAGLGSVGTGITSGGVTWTNGWNAVGVIGHELGHNLGLGHSQLLDCTAGGVRVMDGPPSSCTPRVYADTNDIMAVSWNNQGFLNAVHLRTLGLLDASAESSPTTSGQVVLAPLEAGTGMRVLVLTDGATHYVLELRQPVGQDAWMTQNPGWGSPGVTVRREFDLSQAGTSAYDSLESYLLDGDPSTPDPGFGQMHNALPVGTWVDVDGGNIGIRVESVSAAGAVVDYRYGPEPAAPPAAPPPAPVRPDVSVPQARILGGTMSVRPSGPVVPVVWTWQVSTPSSTPGGTASVTSGRTSVPSGFALSGWAGASYRAVATASDGTQVAAVGRAETHYTSEAYSRVVKYTRGWGVARATGANGRSVRITARPGAATAFRVTSRSIGVVLARGAAYAPVAIYVDGHRVAVVGNHANRFALRVAWSTTFPSVSAHTVRLVNIGGRRGSWMAFDGLVTLV